MFFFNWQQRKPISKIVDIGRSVPRGKCIVLSICSTLKISFDYNKPGIKVPIY